MYIYFITTIVCDLNVFLIKSYFTLYDKHNFYCFKLNFKQTLVKIKIVLYCILALISPNYEAECQVFYLLIHSLAFVLNLKAKIDLVGLSKALKQQQRNGNIVQLFIFDYFLFV